MEIITLKDQGYCSCCGELRPHPTEPGKWEYQENAGFVAGLPDDDPVKLRYNKWIAVMVVLNDEGHLNIIPEGDKEPIWWPNNVAWRKVS